MKIGSHLSLPDQCRLGSTCHYLRDVMSQCVSNFLRIEELVITSDKDIVRKEFFRKHLSKRVRKIKIVMPDLSRRCVDFLKDVFEVSCQIQGQCLYSYENEAYMFKIKIEVVIGCDCILINA